MANVSSGIKGDSNLFNLKDIPIEAIREEVRMFLVEDEEIIQAFQSVRDQVIFTTKRVLVVNVQGLTGKKVAYVSYPYAKVQYYGVETAGMLDIDTELFLAFSSGMRLQFDFKTQVDIKRICATLSHFIL